MGNKPVFIKYYAVRVSPDIWKRKISTSLKEILLYQDRVISLSNCYIILLEEEEVEAKIKLCRLVSADDITEVTVSNRGLFAASKYVNSVVKKSFYSDRSIPLSQIL